MPETRKILVTTSELNTWPTNDFEIVLLGEWCKNYDIIDNYHYKLVPPFGFDDKVAHYNAVNLLYEFCLDELVIYLNKIHTTNHSNRYWRIIIGPWLNTFIALIYKYWYTSDEAIKLYNVNETILYNLSLEQVVPKNMTHFQKLYLSSLWNNYIIGKILISKGVAAKLIDINSVINTDKRNSFKTKFKNLFKRSINNISYYISRNNCFFFINSYIPTRYEFGLQLLLKQIPSRWYFEDTIDYDSIKIERNDFQSCNSQAVQLKEFLLNIIHNQIPLIYLEGYKTLTRTSENLLWPKSPKLIFTANSGHLDDVFKCWVASKTENGTKYVYGQHGGLYGAGSPPTFFEYRELKSVDRFLTWGWDDESNKKVIKSVITKELGIRKMKINITGSLLMITMVSLRFVPVPWDVSLQQKRYKNNLLNFAKLLDNKIREKMIVRLSPFDKIGGLPQNEIWKIKYPDIEISDEDININKLINSSRIILITYNATGLLEVLSRNIPTVIYWEFLDDEIREDAKVYYEALKKAGILFNDIKSASNKINSIWDNVYEWWNGRDIQNARIFFCERFARKTNNNLFEIKNNLIF